MTNTLAYHFDYSCPYAYIGSRSVESFAKECDAGLVWEPFLLGGVFRAVGTPQKLFATLSAAKSKHNMEDIHRFAALYNCPLTMPSAHPFRTVEALRATLLARTPEGALDARVIHGFFDAYWVRNEPISEEATLRRVLTEAGHDADAILPHLSEAKGELIARTDKAIALGVFGAPAYVTHVDGEAPQLFWGQDRLHLVRHALTGARVPLDGMEGTARATQPHTLEVFYDYASPFAYLGASQVDAIQKRTGCKVVWKPFLLGGLFKAIGQVDVPIQAFSEVKRAYTMRDMERWAAHWNVPFKFPSVFPMRSVEALRFTLAMPENIRAPVSREGNQRTFQHDVFEAAWGNDEDIASREVLMRIAARHVDEATLAEVSAKASSESIKMALRDATAEAEARGVFGAPTFIVDGEALYWGQDRLGLVERALRV